MTWVVFFMLAAGIVYAGSRLTRCADQIAEEFGLARSWMGLLVVGLVTSLPEIATTISSVTKVAAPDLAVGNIFGSVLFNLFILAICDTVFRKGGLLRFTDRKNAVSAALDIVIIATALLALVFPVTLAIGPLRMGWGAPAVMVIGVAAFALTYHVAHATGPTIAEVISDPAADHTRATIVKFALSSVAVVVLGYGLAVTGDRLAAEAGLSHTFVGTLFLALATSLPELIVSITAIRMGAYDLMLGNILGSNIWNVMIYGLADVVYTKDVLSVPSSLGWGQVFTGVLGIVATIIVLVALMRRPTVESRRPVAWETPILVGLFLLCQAALFFGWWGL